MIKEIIEIILIKSEIKAEFEMYIRDGCINSEITNFMEGTYGYQKNGKKLKAISLITKYVYYLTDGNFPIYDSIVKRYQGKIAGIWNLNVPVIKSTCSLRTFLKSMQLTKMEIEKIYLQGSLHYNELDSLIWLIGKLHNYSTSLILNRKQFNDIINLADNESIDSYLKRIDIRILERIIGTKLCDMFAFIHNKLR